MIHFVLRLYALTDGDGAGGVLVLRVVVHLDGERRRGEHLQADDHLKCVKEHFEVTLPRCEQFLRGRSRGDRSYQQEDRADDLPAYPPVDVGGLLDHLKDVAP